MFQKQMYDVSSLGVNCSVCGNAITQLPFMPDPARTATLKCGDCIKASRPAGGDRGGSRGGFGGGSRGGFGGGAQRQQFDVTAMNITCVSCGAAITSLPFMPRATSGIYCKDCNRNRTDR